MPLFPLPSSSRTVHPSPRFPGQCLTDSDSGGLEMLFSNERKHKISLPSRVDGGSQPNIAYLLQYLVHSVMKDQRKELFIMEDNVYVIWSLLYGPEANLFVAADQVSLF